MNFFAMNIAALLVGFVLDLIIGDPEGWTHPVIWIGKWISFMEKKLRKRGGNLRKYHSFARFRVEKVEKFGFASCHFRRAPSACTSTHIECRCRIG